MSVTPADDTRGIVRPDRLGEAFVLERRAPRPPLDRFVDRFWTASWDLPDGVTHEQRLVTHPVVNLVFQDGYAVYSGVSTDTFATRLAGRGRVIGVMFRAGGFRPFLGRPMTTITDRSFPIEDLFGTEAGELAHLVTKGEFDDAVDIVSRFLCERAPTEPTLGEEVSAVVETIAADPAVESVSDLATRLNIHPRRLQRLFSDQVGVSPSWVIRRTRLHAAAEEAKRPDRRSWAELAVSLGYADQAHLTRRFAETIGEPPGQYASHVAGPDRRA